MSHKYVYLFSEGSAKMRELLGGKGANLAEMTTLGLPVPFGFTVTTEACTRYYTDKKMIAQEIIEQIEAALVVTEEKAGKKFGDPSNPFLVSVRSGARASMPGMMDTILNLGLNDETVVGLAKLTNNERFAFDSYRRFISMFSDVVMEIEKAKFDEIFDEIKHKNNCKLDTDLNAENLKEVVKLYKAMYLKEKGSEFPQDPREQLMEAIKAVFRSWDNPRAIVYRRKNDIPYDWGTAVNVQSMVFGNMGNDCGTGVAFTRNPSTGEKKLYGEFLMNAQGEDVVAGIRTPSPIDELKVAQPEVYQQFVETAEKLEQHYRDMQDMEFTIERGRLFMLQTRNGKRTAAAALQIAVDLVAEGMISKEEAIAKIDPRSLDALLHPTFEPKALKNASAIASGLPASPGAACGRVYFTAEDAMNAHKAGEKVILARLETSPEDIEGMYASEGILTARGGMTSHAAVVARGMGTCCVAGCSEATISEKNKTLVFASGKSFKEGDWISLDGSTGNVYGEALPTIEAKVSGNFATIMQWADEFRTLHVRTNADTPHDAEVAVMFGAEGIGLCRTEHMFFDETRIPAMREMIVSKDVESRKRALNKLLPMQRGDFKGIYKAMGGRPVTIRFLDPPLHEFLPSEEEDIRALAKEMNLTYEDLLQTVESLHEFNPMLGHRGCRLAVTYPEIAEMQTRAVIEAAIEVRQETGIEVVPEIMIPLVGEVKELEYVKETVDETAKAVMAERGIEIPYMVGTMIEVPRAALTADKIAEHAEFFSFGTNDLSQMTFGFSRDDAGKFLDDYYKKKIFESDPFARLDQEGVGKLVKMAVELGKSVRKDIKLGICGEHGGDPSSIEFCHKIGLNYVSCSPFRVPIARLAAAQAKINEKK
ncbi:MAG: pyruvate, phosphate dikinase [Firmicutes bacterium HGW-Firmicutes-9]|nr:MAG: pyruvate, phosphate dikinase [Firmicutes bacterium HGW-Firmicutes-9]